MNSDNPYQPPATTVDVVEQQSDDVWEFTDPKRLPAGRGWFWIAEGFRLFAKSPLISIINMIIYIIITVFISILPFISIVIYILNPIFIGGLMRGTQTLDTGGSYEVSHLFCGFSEKGSKLAILGALQLGIFILYGLVIGILAAIFVGTSAFLNQNGANVDPEAIFTSVAFIAFIPIFVISTILLAMAFWLSPQLVMLHDLEAFAAIKMSFIGCWRNILPLIVFVLLGLLVTVLVVVPTFGIGILVIWPVMIISAAYVAWKDIFTNAYPV